MTNNWLLSLKTPDPQSGYELAIKLSRMAVKMTQSDEAIRSNLRGVYENDANALIAVSAVVATNFQTVAAANEYWNRSK
jgi:hypothetical protein